MPYLSEDYPLTVAVLRGCFRHLQMFRALYETTGTDILTNTDGHSICLHDVEWYYSLVLATNDEGKPRWITPRQVQAIELFLVQDMGEQEVMDLMGLTNSNPHGQIAIYSSKGLETLVRLVNTQQVVQHRIRKRVSA